MKEKQKKIGQKGVTLIALIVTIIVLLILAGVTINLIINNGIIERAKTVDEKYEESSAREKLETELAALRVDKEAKESYNENEYVTNKLIEQEFIVNENIIIVDGYQYEIDREKLIIVSSLGKGNENKDIKIVASQEVAKDYGTSTIKVEIEYEDELSSIKLGNEELELPTKTENKYAITKEITKNGKYSILVKDEEDGYAISNITVSELTEDMIIRTAKELGAFRDKVNAGGTYEGKTVSLGNDIDLSKVCYKVDGTTQNDISWVPISNSENLFKGTFDGNNKKISNLYINNALDSQALFGYNNGNIKNVCLTNSNIIANNYSAGIVSNNNGVVEKCFIENSNTVTGKNYVGGVVSVNYNIVRYCSNSGNAYINAGTTQSFCGGVVGFSTNESEIYSCYNSGYVSCEGQGPLYINIGGVLGYLCYDSVGEGLYNSGDVYVKGSCSEWWMFRVGGVVGTVYPGSALLKYCYNVGTVTVIASNGVTTYTGDVLGSLNLGIAQNLFGIKANVIGYSDGKYSNCLVGIPSASDISSEYFMDNPNGGYPLLKWQIEN